MSGNKECCHREVFEYNAGYPFWSLLASVKECFVGVICCVDEYALRSIDALLSPSARGVIFYAKYSGSYSPRRVGLIQLDNHYKHYLFDDWGVAKGTMNLSFFELEARSADELNVEIALCPVMVSECSIAESVFSVIMWAFRSRPEAWEMVSNTSCASALKENMLGLSRKVNE